MRAIFEIEHEFDSVVIWEGGTGHRITYQTPESAETAARWLAGQSYQLHKAKEVTGTASIEVYGEPCSEYEFIRRFLSLCKSAGLKVVEDSMTRPPKDFW